MTQSSVMPGRAPVTTNWNQRVEILCSTSHNDVLYFVYHVVDVSSVLAYQMDYIIIRFLSLKVCSPRLECEYFSKTQTKTVCLKINTL